MEVKKRQFLIQIDRPGESLDLSTIEKLLKGTGVQLDRKYGPILINLNLGRYVVRGVATPEGRVRAEKISGVRFFSDVKMEPTWENDKTKKGANHA